MFPCVHLHTNRQKSKKYLPTFQSINGKNEVTTGIKVSQRLGQCYNGSVITACPAVEVTMGTSVENRINRISPPQKWLQDGLCYACGSRKALYIKAFRQKENARLFYQNYRALVVAEEGFEPTTFGLWALICAYCIFSYLAENPWKHWLFAYLLLVF